MLNELVLICISKLNFQEVCLVAKEFSLHEVFNSQLSDLSCNAVCFLTLCKSIYLQLINVLSIIRRPITRGSCYSLVLSYSVSMPTYNFGC